MKSTDPVILSPQECTRVNTWARGKRFPVRPVQRALIIQMAADGVQYQDIAQEMGAPRSTELWRRFLAFRLEGLGKDAPRPGRIPKIPVKKFQPVDEATLHTMPPNATHWSTRSMAKSQGFSEAMIRHLWKQHNLIPHQINTCTASCDKHFFEKLYDVVGLYLDPRDKSLVLCVGEKNQIQALDRTWPGLPMRKGRCRP